MSDKPLLRKYLNGQCTPEEIMQVHQFLADEKADVTALQEVLDESWNDSTGEQADETQSERIIKALRHRLYPTPIKRWMKYAAAAAILFIVATVIYWPRDQKIATSAWKTITNKGTITQSATLPDSSKVWLTPGTTLEYTTEGERTVKLKGEAFFDVAQQAAQPFVVYSGDVATRVLGTAFNIEAYAQEATIRVSLVRGKVAVGTTHLQAGEMLIYQKNTKAVTKEKLQMTDIANWTQGYVIFNDVPIAAALERIAARYNRKLNLGGNNILTQKKITTLFKTTDMNEMLNLLLFVTQHSYTDDGHTITIIKK